MILNPPPDTRRAPPLQRIPRSARSLPFTLTVQDLRFSGDATSATVSGIARPDETGEADTRSMTPSSPGVKREIDRHFLFS